MPIDLKPPSPPKIDVADNEGMKIFFKGAIAVFVGMFVVYLGKSAADGWLQTIAALIGVGFFIAGFMFSLLGIFKHLKKNM